MIKTVEQVLREIEDETAAFDAAAYWRAEEKRIEQQIEWGCQSLEWEIETHLRPRIAIPIWLLCTTVLIYVASTSQEHPDRVSLPSVFFMAASAVLLYSYFTRRWIINQRQELVRLNWLRQDAAVKAEKFEEEISDE